MALRLATAANGSKKPKVQNAAACMDVRSLFQDRALPSDQPSGKTELFSNAPLCLLRKDYSDTIVQLNDPLFTLAEHFGPLNSALNDLSAKADEAWP